jgi:hypothetical protein
MPGRLVNGRALRFAVRSKGAIIPQRDEGAQTEAEGRGQAILPGFTEPSPFGDRASNMDKGRCADRGHCDCIIIAGSWMRSLLFRWRSRVRPSSNRKE